MPMEYAGFRLKPNGVFAESPVMDVPATNGQGLTQPDASCCT